MFQIEDDIPLAGKSRDSKYPFAEMKIGQSFFAKDLKASSLASAARQFGKNNPDYKFTVRAVEGGARVWRVAAE